MTMKGFLLLMLSVTPASADVGLASSSQAVRANSRERIEYVVNAKADDIQIVPRPMAIRMVSLWRYKAPLGWPTTGRDSPGEWQRVSVRTRNTRGEPYAVLLAPHMNSNVSLRMFLDGASITPGLYYAIAEVDGDKERALIYVASAKCQDVMIGPPHDKLVPACVPTPDGSGGGAKFVPDPALLQP
jgi:hypothetical protein